MIDPIGRSKIAALAASRTLSLAGASVVNRAVTDILHVSPDGNGLDGTTWDKAFQTLPEALATASVSANDLTLFLLSSHSTYYDIDVTGDPTYTGNYYIKGSFRNLAKIVNTHAAATSIMKFTGNIALENLTFDPLATAINGVILSGAGAKGAYLKEIYFEGENVTGPHTFLEVSGGIEYVRLEYLKFHGVRAHTRALFLDNCALGNFEHLNFHDILTAIQIANAASDSNIFDELVFNSVTLGLDIDAGNKQIFNRLHFHDCTERVDDEVGDHYWSGIYGEFPITVEPADFVGVTVAAHVNADTWGADTELRAALTSTKPFRIVGYVFEPGIAQYYRVGFSADSGTSFFDDVLFDTARSKGSAFPSGTEYIFNKGTRISCSAKALTGGEDTVQVWLKIQEI